MLEDVQRQSPPPAAVRFNHVKTGPARTLQHCLDALRRGDCAVVLAAHRRSERQALLTEVARLAGRNYCRVVRIEGAEAGPGFEGRLAGLDLIDASESIVSERRSTWQDTPDRTLLIIDEAEMMPAHLLIRMARLRDGGRGGRVQVLLAGAPCLLPLLCEPACADIWRKIRLFLSLGDAQQSARPHDLLALQAEIARTEARLEAQRRVLSIFTDGGPDPAARFSA